MATSVVVALIIMGGGWPSPLPMLTATNLLDFVQYYDILSLGELVAQFQTMNGHSGWTILLMQ